MLMRYTGSCAPSQEASPGTPSFDMHAAALWWHGLGLNVVPQDMQAKHPSVRWKAYQLERITPFELHRLRNKFQRGGIGVICGAISNLIVVDFDTVETGLTLIREWEQQHSPLPPTRVVLSGSGHGFHLHFAHPGYEVRNQSYASIKTDIRGDGGYAVLPPSKHSSGSRYRLLDDGCTGVADLPGGLLQFLADRAGASGGRGGRRASGVKDIRLPPPPTHVTAAIAARAELPPCPSAACPPDLVPFGPIVRRCHQMNHFSATGCRERGEEPAWKACLGTLAFVQDGERLAHALSSIDPRYDEAQTQAKLDSRKDLDGPTRCSHFQSLGNGLCTACPYAALVSSPANLGDDDER